MMFRLIFSCLILAFMGPLALSASLVSNVNDSGTGSFRWAVEQAQNGEKVRFSPEVLGRTIVLQSPVKLPDSKVDIQGPDRQIIIAAPGYAVFKDFTGSSISLSGISFRDAKSIISISRQSEIQVSNCSFRKVDNCFPLIEGNCRISFCSFYKNGNILSRLSRHTKDIDNSLLHFQDCTIESNQGHIIQVKGSLNSLLIHTCSFIKNKGRENEGLISLEAEYAMTTDVQIRDCEFSENQTPKASLIYCHLKGESRYFFDCENNRLSNNRGKILFGELEGKSLLQLEQQIWGTCEGGCESQTSSQGDESTELYHRRFPYFCEGMVVARKSSDAKINFNKLIPEGGGKGKAGPKHDCCLQKVKIL